MRHVALAILLAACTTPSTPSDAAIDATDAAAPMDSPVDSPPLPDVLGPPPPAFDATINGFHVHLDRTNAQITIMRPDGTTLLGGLTGGAPSSDPTAHPYVGIAMRHGSATYNEQFGQFRIADTSTAPWLGVARYGMPTGSDPLSVPLIGGDASMLGTMTIASSGAHGLRIHVTPMDAGNDRVSFALDCAASEHFLGFGGQSFDVDHRGQTIPLWVEEDGIGKNATDTDFTGFPLRGRRHSTHTPMPMFTSSHGYAMMLDTSYRSIFAMCSENPSAIRIENWNADLDLHLLDAPTPADAVTRLTDIVGRPDRAPDTVLAPWLDAIFGSAHVRSIAQRARTFHAPASVIWTEDFRGGMETITGYQLSENWNVDRTLYPDIEQMASDLHADGYAFLTYNNSFVTQGSDVYADGTSMGFCIENGTAPYTFNGSAFMPASLVDYTSPAARTWEESILRMQLTQGADGWMADYAEWLPIDAMLHSGADPIAAHQLYPLEWQRTNRDVLYGGALEPLWFVRSASLRSQALVQVMWAGDQTTDFAIGDGMPSVIPIGIGLGMTGFPYFGSDIGGYTSTGTTTATEELFYRWTTMAALTPVMRTHHGRNAMQNWLWDHDDASSMHFARWARVHQQLFPYLRALADAAAITGAPMMRSMAYDHPEFDAGWSITDQFTLGSSIFVAPVIVHGATSRMVTLPPGRYHPLLGGPVVVSTGTAMSVDAPMAEIPAFVPEGTMIVALPPNVDTVRSVGATSTAITLTSIHDDREIWIYGPGSADFTEGTRTYAWRATGWSGAAASATWNGASATITSGTITVTGNGTLVLDGTAMLTISGGAANRAITIVLR
jgi:alpha-glucosidase